MALVAEDCYYDNVPIGDMPGKAMLEFLGPMFRARAPWSSRSSARRPPATSS